jgi:hypothetical protein
MKRCISCGEIVSGEYEFCRQCGSSYLVNFEGPVGEKSDTGLQESDSGENSEKNSVLGSYSCSQFVVGFLISSIAQLIVFYLGFNSYAIDSSTSFGSQRLIPGVLILLSMLIAWIGVIGWKGKFSSLYFVAILFISYIPIIGNLLVALFVGRGVLCCWKEGNRSRNLSEINKWNPILLHCTFQIKHVMPAIMGIQVKGFTQNRARG